MNYVTIDLTDLVAEAETNTFIKKVAGVVDANDPANSTPTVYYYFSEEAIKDWVDLDPINNTDAYADMAVTEPGVLPIEVTEDVAADFEFILNQEITYEGDTHTIEEIIQMISSEVEGNVIYTEINPGEWVFQYFDGTNYITIDLIDLVAEAETNTFIRIVPETDGPDVYYYFSEEAIKAWLAADSTNTDPEANMPETESGVIKIDVVGDVVENFEYILEQEITYEGDTHTIEEIIQMISSEVEGNVIYTEVNGEWVFQYFDGNDYITIDLIDLVAEAETNTFIRIVPETDGPDVYYYFSEEAIKAWLAADSTNTDPEANMPETESGVIKIDVVGDVVENFEYILEQEITYEGDTHTIEEIIQMISSEVEGNVIYTEVNGEWVFQYFDGNDYITIDLIDLVAEAETNTFIRIVPETDGPDVYYYFSEEAIKAWLAADSTNTDPEANMPETESGVIKIDVVGDVVENFEYILEQEITYEGDIYTIEEIIQIISSEVEGNVIYTEVNGEMVFQYYDTTTEEYITINLDELVNELETNTFIRKVDAVIATDGTVTSPTVYYYFSEQAIKDWLTADASNIDPETNMPITATGVTAIELGDDVAANFEYILNQTITYDGDQHTIEEIIQIISSEVEGNVIYTEVNGEMVFQYYDTTTEEYITINLDELVNELETNTFIRKVDAVIATDGTVTSPTVYYYFSEQAIKDWLAADASNIDPETNMPITATGVTAIELGDDVATNFEYILNQTITYDGDQHTIEEIIQIISSEVEGNVIYINDKDPNDPNAPDNWVFQYFDGTEYVSINLGDLVADLETKTKITRAEITNDGDTSNYVDTIKTN